MATFHMLRVMPDGTIVERWGDLDEDMCVVRNVAGGGDFAAVARTELAPYETPAQRYDIYTRWVHADTVVQFHTGVPLPGAPSTAW
jgi:hypothetical protein